MEILELKNTMTEIKISVDALNSKRRKQERNSELKDKTLEINLKNGEERQK